MRYSGQNFIILVAKIYNWRLTQKSEIALANIQEHEKLRRNESESVGAIS